MGQFPVRKVGDTLWLGERPIMPEETRASLEEFLALSGATFRDVAFSNDEDQAAFEARFGPV
jgi:hypothetical protein